VGLEETIIKHSGYFHVKYSTNHQVQVVLISDRSLHRSIPKPEAVGDGEFKIHAIVGVPVIMNIVPLTAMEFAED
jgi:hypothetical protein